MPLLLRHLMPLIVIASLFVFSISVVLAILAFFARLFRRPEATTRPMGPIVEGTARTVEDGSAASRPGASEANIGGIPRN